MLREKEENLFKWMFSKPKRCSIWWKPTGSSPSPTSRQRRGCHLYRKFQFRVPFNSIHTNEWSVASSLISSDGLMQMQMRLNLFHYDWSGQPIVYWSSGSIGSTGRGPSLQWLTHAHSLLYHWNTENVRGLRQQMAMRLILNLGSVNHWESTFHFKFHKA